MGIPNIDINMILSDPALMVGSILVVLGPVLFLFSLVKFLRSKSKPHFVVPEHHAVDEEVQPQEHETLSNGHHHEEPAPPVEPAPVVERPRVQASLPLDEEPAGEKTVVLPPYVSELQAQLEIIVANIKQMNKRLSGLERQMEEKEAVPSFPPPTPAPQPDEPSEPRPPVMPI